MASRQPRPGHRRRRIPRPARPRLDVTSHPPRSPQSTTLLVATLAARRDVGRRPAGTARRPLSGTARAAPPHGTAADALRRRLRPPAALPHHPAVASRPAPPTVDHHTQGSGASSVPHGRDRRAVNAPPAPSTRCHPTRPGRCHHAVHSPTQTASRAPPLRPYSPGRSGRASSASSGSGGLAGGHEAPARIAAAALPDIAPASRPAGAPLPAAHLPARGEARSAHAIAAAQRRSLASRSPGSTARPLQAAMSRPGHPDRYRR